MAKKKDLEEMLKQTAQPFSSPAFDTFSAAWAVSQRQKKTAETMDRTAATSPPDANPDTAQAVAGGPEVLRRKTENLFQGPVLDTFTAAWAASKDKIKVRTEPKPDNVQIVRQIYTHLLMTREKDDLTPILHALSEDVEWRSPGPEAIPWAGTVRGREQVAHWFATRGKVIAVEQLVPKEFIAQGNQVVVLCDEHLRVQASGKGYAVAVVAVWTLLHGMVTHYRESYDTAAVLAALRNDSGALFH